MSDFNALTISGGLWLLYALRWVPAALLGPVVRELKLLWAEHWAFEKWHNEAQAELKAAMLRTQAAEQEWKNRC